MLEVNHLTISYDDYIIINDLSFVINKKDKMAIVGEEGNGKTTILKALANINSEANIKGIINTKQNSIGYLKQQLTDEELNKTVFNYLFETQEKYYDLVTEFYETIKQLNINDKILDQLLKTLSGGEKVKIQILKLLLDGSDILLLDEPTNDLDLETVVWLEEFLKNTNRPVIYVSHDEKLLKETANIILHLERINKKQIPKHTVMKINYQEYIDKRNSNIEKQSSIAKKERAEYKKQVERMNQIRNRVEHEQNSISRSDPHGGKMLKRKMKQVKNQMNRIEDKELTEIPDYEEGMECFFNDVKVPSTKIILDEHIDTLKIGDKILARNIDIFIKGNKNIIITGKNGVGKSTLLKELLKRLEKRNDIKVGYMPQHYNEVLDDSKTVLDYLVESTKKSEWECRNLLSSMKITKEEQVSIPNSLSGGSIAKVLFANLILNEYNVLLLDEPTRNLSPLSVPSIKEALLEYNGVIISISHDRNYISSLADEVYELTEKGLTKALH